MAYCVNCGVKLAPTEKKCPLCDTKVNNPACHTTAETENAYPALLETLPLHKINWRYIVKLILLVLAGAALITVSCDLITTQRLTWSVYSLLTAAYIGCSCSFLYFKSPYVSLAVWNIGTVILTGAVAWLNNGWDWYSYLAAPFLVFLGIYTVFCTWLLKRKSKSLLRKIAYCLLFCDIVLIGIECLTDLYIHGAISLFWSIYAVFPITVISIGLILLSFNRRLLDEIKRRTFL